MFFDQSVSTQRPRRPPLLTGRHGRNVILALLLQPCLIAPVTAAETLEASAEMPAISPRRVIHLFNGKDLSGLYTWLKGHQYEDPDQVFSVRDGMLYISGNGLGYICTKARYRDYHLVVEYKWGEKTWGDRKEKARDTGVLVHCNGPDGNYNGTWMNSIEAQIIEGGVGDFVVVQGKDAQGNPMDLSLTAEVAQDRDGENVWKQGGQKKTFSRGRVNWYGRDPDWQDVLGFRGDQDLDSPVGEWTRLEVICDGDRITNKVNGVVVNQASEVNPYAGKILIQTELAEVFIRRWDLLPLAKSAEEGKRAEAEGGEN